MFDTASLNNSQRNSTIKVINDTKQKNADLAPVLDGRRRTNSVNQGKNGRVTPNPLDIDDINSKFEQSNSKPTHNRTKT